MLMAFLASVSNIDFGAGSQVNINSPYAIMVNMLMFAGLASFFIPAIAASAALRDENHKMDELVFSKPIQRKSLFFSFFIGTFIASMLMFCGVAIGLLTAEVGAKLGLFGDASKLADTPFTTQLGYYLFGLFALALPSILFSSSLYFFVARLTRSVSWVYVVVITTVAMFPLHQVLYSVDTRAIVTQTDTMGIFAFMDATRYWSVFERNHQMIELSGLLLQNRLIWLSMGLLFIAAGYLSFHPRLKRTTKKPKATRSQQKPNLPSAIIRPALQQIKNPAIGWFIQFYRFELKASANLIFIAILTVFALNLLLGANNTINNFEGAAHYPTTAFMLDRIKESFLFSIYLLIIFYSAVVVHRHKDVGFKALIDVMPINNGVRLMAQYSVLLTLIVLALLSAMATSVLIQLLYGYSNINIGVYLWALLINQGMAFYLMAGFALLLQLLLNHKYLGMLATTMLILSQKYAPELGLEHYLWRVDIAPAPWSDINGFGHFTQAHGWFSVYWLLMLSTAFMLVNKIYPRGSELSLFTRLKSIRFTARDKLPAAFAVMTVIVAGYIFYHTNILNHYQNAQQQLANRANGEKLFAAAQHWPQLSMTDVTVAIDLYPQQLHVSSTGEYQLINNTAEPIKQVLLRVAPHLTVGKLQLEGAKLTQSYPQLGYYLFEAEQSFLPQQQIGLSFSTDWQRKGFKNHGESIQLLENGSFFRPTDLMPGLGYLAAAQLTDSRQRSQFGLGELQRMPSLASNQGRNITYLGNLNRVNFAATISTSADQHIITSGELTRRWQQDGRNFFHYQSEQPIGFAFPIHSGRYQLKSIENNGIKLAIYYQQGHQANIDVMMQAMQDSLRYYRQQWGAYPHKSLSIVEYPGYSANAMSLPGVIAFSESHGFAANVSQADKLNRVYFTTAHEVAHQWWANQLIGANVQGAMLLTESVAQYAAMQVMEQRFGQKMARQFKRYELNRYLSARSGEQQAEMPLLQVEQAYVAYHKGALALSAISALLGEADFNQALANFFSDFKHQAAPYPTSSDLYRHIIKLTPPSLRPKVDELLAGLVLYDASVKNLTVVEPTDETVSVSVDVMIKRWTFEGTGQESETRQALTSSLEFYDKDDNLLGEVSVAAGFDSQTIRVQLPGIPASVRIDPDYLLLDKVPGNNVVRW
ncbi:MAG: ABC-2 type transport system permease protein [Phenylobacterium sp.]|jgi:ABC-2 type transport system permease protein